MIKKMSKDKALLMLSILLIAAVQMPSLALSPSINQIKTTVFPNASLSTIQTIMQLPNIISPIITITTAYLFGKGIIAKKPVIVTGVFLVGITGVLSIFAHSEFWHIWLLNSCLGLGLSGYISAASSLIVDYFEPEERRVISGYQTSFINGGGILMSLCGGLLATLCWFGGYLMLMIALPVAVLALKAIPGGKSKKAEPSGEKVKVRLHSDVFLFGSFIFVLMLVYNVIGSNLSTHISHMGNTAIAGYATAVQMLGGVICGLFFGKLSRKIGEFTACLAFLAMFICMMLLSIFPDSLPMTFVAVIIGGTALSLMMPTCMYSVSKVTNESNSALATSVTSCICPSLGAFLSAIIFTNLTTALYGESTVMRYRFVSFVALACAVIVFIIISIRHKKQKQEE